MKQTLLLIITIAVGIGCKDKQDQKIWERNNDSTSWVGEGYSEDTATSITFDYHWCINDSCPHTMFYKAQGDNYETITIPLDKFGNNPTPPCPQITKWTDASKADKGFNFKIRGGSAISTGIVRLDSLGIIIEDTVKRLGGGIITKWTDDFQEIGTIDTVRLKPDTGIHILRACPDSLP